MSATYGMEVAGRILKSKALFTAWGKVKSLKGFKQSADHGLRVLHVGYNIRDTVSRYAQTLSDMDGIRTQAWLLAIDLSEAFSAPRPSQWYLWN